MSHNTTRVYFVRHAKPDFSVHDDNLRPLTEEGLEDCKKVSEFLMDKQITKIYSSPYKRAIYTVNDFAKFANIEITIEDDFRERKVDGVWIEDFNSFVKEQWKNFDYKLTDGECLNEVQKRNISKLNEILLKNRNEQIVIGTHGTALSTIIHYYKKDFGYQGFERIKFYMPFIVLMEFKDLELIDIKEFKII